MKTNNLRPAAVVVDDYEIAQGPSFGGEREVLLCAKPSLFLGIATLTSDGVVSYEAINGQITRIATGSVSVTELSAVVTGTGTKFTTEVEVGDRITIDGVTKEVAAIASDTSLTADSSFDADASGEDMTIIPQTPIVAFVMNELRAESAPVITLGDLTATLEAANYARNKSFNFPATRGVELIGDGAVLIDTDTEPTITNAKRGTKVGFVQLPKLADFSKVGCTTTKDIEIPSKTSKSVSCGLETSRYNKGGRTKEGSLSISSRDLVADDGLRRFAGMKCVALIETHKEEKILTDRQVCTNYVPGLSNRNPDSDDESELSAEGNFQHMITLVAP